MASSLTSIASSGLKAAQVLLNTTSNNITNVYTDGYSRQTVTLSSTTTSSGVAVSSVNRAYEALTVAQLRSASASYAATSSYYDQISQIDSLLSSDDSSIDTLLSNFFSSLSDLSADASDSSARQAVLSSAESLVSQLQTIDDYLTSMDSAINQQITTSIDQVNSYAEQIAELNEQITKLGSDSSSANALLDQRDQLINELNDIIGVTVSTQDDSVVTVSLSNGLTLVQGNTAYSLTAVTDSADTSRLTIAYDNGSGNLTNINESEISGGSIAGLFAVRDDIDSTRNTLGQIALELASNLNELQSEGYDLDGEPGTDFFTYDDPAVSAYTTNSGSASLTATYSDTSAVAASDYTLAYKDGNWTVTKASDGSTIDYTTGTDDDGNTTLTFDGLTVAVSGTADSGDSFTVETVSSVISSLAVALNDGSLIAAAGTTTGDSDNSNLTKMQALQTSDLINGTYTLTESYAALIGNIGVKTSSADNLATSQSTIVTTLTAQQQSVSGVNLDEEYVNLTAYQQYYSACAQVLSTANTIFDSLLSAIN